jgi:hypothetical protein
MVTATTSDASALEAANELADRYLTADNDHDLEAIARCLADDVVYDAPDQPEQLRGRTAVLDWMSCAFAAMPDFHVDERERWIAGSGTTVATRLLCLGTFNGVAAGDARAPG